VNIIELGELNDPVVFSMLHSWGSIF